MSDPVLVTCTCGVMFDLRSEGEGFVCNCGKGYIRQGDKIICNQDPQPSIPAYTALPVPEGGLSQCPVCGEDVSGLHQPWCHVRDTLQAYTGLPTPAGWREVRVGTPAQGEIWVNVSTGEPVVAAERDMLPDYLRIIERIPAPAPVEAACVQYCGGAAHPVSWCPTHGWLEGSPEMNGGACSEYGLRGEHAAYGVPHRCDTPAAAIDDFPCALRKPTPAPLYKKHAGPQPRWRSTL